MEVSRLTHPCGKVHRTRLYGTAVNGHRLWGGISGWGCSYVTVLRARSESLLLSAQSDAALRADTYGGRMSSVSGHTLS